MVANRLNAAEAAQLARAKHAGDPHVAEFLRVVYAAIRDAARRGEAVVDDPWAGLRMPGPDVRQLSAVAGALAADGYRVTVLESMPPKLVIRWGDPGETDGDGC